MSGITLPNTGIVLPELGGDAGDWDDLTNACWGNYDVHDHSPGKGVRVPTAGIEIDDDLTFGGYGATDLSMAAFAEVPALSAGATTLFVSDADSELYWRTAAGVNVKLTSGTSINTSLIGGIAGDYSAVSAEVAYDAANERYTFKMPGSPKTWAHIAGGDLRLYEHNTSETVYVGIKAPAGLAGSFDITLPDAAPASQVLLQMDASGNVIASNTLASNASITLSGTGLIKHGTRNKTQAFVPAAVTAGSFATGTDGAGNLSPCILAASTVVHADVKGLQQSDQVSALVVRGTQLTGAGSMTYDVLLQRPSSALYTSLLSAPVTDSGDAVTLTLASPYLVSGGDILWVAASCPAANTWSLYSLMTQYGVG